MDLLSVYLPIDRCQVLVNQYDIVERGRGAGLFADLSGFTALTELLVRDLGPQRGAEELLVFLDRIYDPLISQVHHYGGSVIGFSGDAITCWFAEDSGEQATACAMGMQEKMGAFSTLKTSSGKDVSIGLKAAVAVGVARRFLVGDPDIQIIDVLAGEPLEKLASAEHLASRGEVIIDAATIESLSGKLDIRYWRQDESSGDRYAVLDGLNESPIARSWPGIPDDALSVTTLRPWLLPDVYERLKSGKGEYLAELRPSVALFLRFGGIDYANDDAAGDKLDRYIRQVQRVITRFEGSLIQLTIGDKGSYLFASFGAPVAHEDDCLRAVAAANELKRLAPVPEQEGKVQIGISRGRMRAGAYGGRERRTYGVLGPHTNLAARLMQAAGPGQVLISQIVQSEADVSFDWEALPALKLKGFAEPVAVFSLIGAKAQQAMYVQEPRYSLPMVGREQELALIENRLEQARQGHGQIVSINAEAGMGKSRLAAEVIKIASKYFMCAYSGECQSYGTNISYHLWHSVWRGFFGVDPTWSLEDIQRELRNQLQEVNPNLVQRMPLLSLAINIPLEENELTRSMDAKLRKNSLETLLIECLRARAQQDAILIVLEDTHWMDALSSELLIAIGRSISDLPVLLLMARRPSSELETQDNVLCDLPNYTLVELKEFTQAEAERLIQIKLERFFDGSINLSTELVEHILNRAQGNPFYIEELLNYLKDKDVDPSDLKALSQLDLPQSLHSLILTRIDQRTESQKITLKLSSIIGRLFIAAWLWGAFPEMGDVLRVREDLMVLNQLDLIQLDSPEPETTYLFKHVITQEVAYESLPFATRAILHDQLAKFIEEIFHDQLDQYVDLLAFHYERTDDLVKKQEYLYKAGLAAQSKYANRAAISYYQRLLPLVEKLEQVDVMIKLGEVLETIGEWDEAERQYREGLEIANSFEDRRLQACCQIAIGELFRKRGSFQEAADWMDAARQGFNSAGDLEGVGRVLHYTGNSYAQRGDYESAEASYQESLQIRRQLNDKINIANLLNNLGILARYRQETGKANELYMDSLSIRRELGDRVGVAVSLNNLGVLAQEQGDYQLARDYLEEAIAIQRQIGAKYHLANFLNSLGNVTRAQGDYAEAKSFYRESLEIDCELGASVQIAYILEDMGSLAALTQEYQRAVNLISAATALREELGSPLPPHERAKLDETLVNTRRALDPSEQEQAWRLGMEMSLKQAVSYALKD
jgi:adenylate cyclase